MSFKRLGIAFAFDEKVFTSGDEEAVLALALSYDFSSYASIAYGKNFAGESISDYISLGINQKAFLDLVKAVVGLF